MIPRNSCVGIRPLNCADENDEGKLCPRCKQYHLRPGYCQALDPINAAKYPQFHPVQRDKVPSRHRADTDTLRGKNVAGQQKQPETETDKRFNETDNSRSETDNLKSETDNPGHDELSVSICNGCGHPFQPKRTDSKYCSPACRLTAHRKQKSPQ